MDEDFEQSVEGELDRINNLPFSIPQKLKAILRGFKWANRLKNTSAVIVIDGRSGMGKSTLAFQIGLYCDRNFNLEDNVHFTPEQFLQGLSTAKPYSVHILDEAMLLSGRSSMSVWNRTIVQGMSMIRSKKIIVIFCINAIFDLDKNLALSRADLLLSVYGDSLTDRGKFMAFFKGEDGMERIKLLYLMGKKYYDYSKPKSNFNTTFSSYFIFDDDEYEKKKQISVNAFLSGQEKHGGEASKRSRDNLIKWIRNKHPELTIKDLADISKVSERTISYALED